MDRLFGRLRIGKELSKLDMKYHLASRHELQVTESDLYPFL